MRASEKFEAKAHAPKMLARSGFLHVENVFGRQRRHRALQPAAIERVIWIGSKNQAGTAIRKLKGLCMIDIGLY